MHVTYLVEAGGRAAAASNGRCAAKQVPPPGHSCWELIVVEADKSTQDHLFMAEGIAT
jgi:hypothetical protein